MLANTNKELDIKSEDYISPEEYFAMEEQAEYKSEYEGGKIINMAGASLFHERICKTLTVLFHAKINESECEVFPSNLKVEVKENGKYYYPDLSIVCGEVDLVHDRDDIILNPILILEVISNSSSHRDRGKKMQAYMKLPSLKEYVLVDQYKPCIEVYSFQQPGKWLYQIYEYMEEIVTFSRIQVQLAIKDIYNKISFEME